MSMMTMMMREDNWNFIDKYIELMSNITDAPEEFQRAAALYLVSTMAGRKYMISSAPEVKFFSLLGDITGRQINLWYILIGKSRITRKSTVVGRVEEFIDAINPTLKLRQSFTPQALIEDLKERSQPTGTRATWIHDEISGFFEQLSHADYMASVDTLLSRLYDGRDYTSRTISRGEAVIKKPYITCFHSSTEHLPSIFTENQIRQGFLNRFIFVCGKRTRHLPIAEQLNPNDVSTTQMLSEWLRNLYETNIAKTFVMRHDTQPMYSRFEDEIEALIINKTDSLEESYLGNIPNIAYRVAAIHALADLPIEELQMPTSQFVQIAPENMEWAIEYSRECIKNFMTMLDLMRSNALSKASYTDERKIERVYHLIEVTGQITRTELYRKAKIVGDELEQVINTLVMQERIRITKSDSPTRPTLLYKTV